MKFKKEIFMLLIVITSILNCQGTKYKKYEDKDFAMGTFLTITFFSSKKNNDVEKIIDDSFAIADQLEKNVSSKINTSYISRLNQEGNLLIDDIFIYDLILESIKYSEKTNGAFDPTLFHLIKLWDFESNSEKIPDSKEITGAKLKSGYKNIKYNADTRNVILENNIALDLGGIAKGKIIGEIASYLDKQGIKDYIVNGGGDIAVKGLYKNERKWRIAIVNPFSKNNFIGMIDLSNASIVTSGDYERYFIGKDDVRYHHILDPKTGYPARNSIHSVTVITDDPTKADAYATAFFVMGKDIGLSYANKFDNVEAIFILGTEDEPEILTTDNITYEILENGMYKFELTKEIM